MDPERVVNVERFGEDGLNGKASDRGAGPSALISHQAGEAELVIFRVSGGRYALEVGNVKEILRYAGMLKVPACPNHVEGIISVRDRLLPVINLAGLLGIGHGGFDDSARVIVVDAGDFTYGILADQVSEMVRVPRERFCKPDHVVPNADTRFIRAFVHVGNGTQIVIVLNPYTLGSANEWNALRSPCPSRGESGNVMTREAGSAYQRAEQEKIVVFQLGGQEYGVTIDCVCEVNVVDEIYRLPGTPDFIEGMASLRGEIVPVLNLRRVFGMPSAGKNARTRLLVVEYKKERIGIRIDAVSEVVSVKRDVLDSVPGAPEAGNTRRFVRRIGTLDGGKRTILILDAPAVFEFAAGSY